MDEQSSAHTDIKGQDMWLADLKVLNKEKYLFRGFVPVQDLISLAWAKALGPPKAGNSSQVGFNPALHMVSWRNWQYAQNLKFCGFIPCGFKSHRDYHPYPLAWPF